MKTEILVAIGLLASGVTVSHLTAKRQIEGVTPKKSTQVAQSARKQHIAATVSQDDSQRLASKLAGPDETTSHNHLIVEAARELAHSPPLEAKLRYKIHLFGEQINGPGKYYQKGQGTRLSRMQFAFGFNESSVQIHQFCDGDVLYTLSIAGDKSNLEFVDLRELDALQQEMSSSSRVSNWLSVGSLTGLLEQLSTHFVFTEVSESRLDNIPVLECTGHWNPAALGRLLEGQVEESAVSSGKVHWKQLPAHLPHRVKLTLGQDDRFPSFPYRVVFEQFSLVEGKQVSHEIAVLELYELKHAYGLSDDMFSLPSVETPPVDSTEFYRKRILQFTR